MSDLHPPDAEQAEGHCLRAQQLWAQGQLAPARASFARAAFCDPGQSRYWRLLDQALAGTVADQISERLRRCLWDGIEELRLDPAELPNVVYSFVCSQPTLQGWIQGRRAGTLATALETLRGLPHDADPELCRMLGLVRVLGVEPELTLQSLRRFLLHDATSPALPSKAMTQLAVALSYPCFASDYAWYRDADEDAQVDSLKTDLSALTEAALLDERRWFQLAVLACYEPLSQLPQSGALLTAAPHSQRADFTRLLRAQIIEPQAEAALRAQIQQLGAIDDPVSLAVRAQYEASPFPRWQTQPNWLPGRGDRSQLRLLPALLQHPAPRILVAGCGTGKHPIATAMSYPQAEVLAIDLSLSSLAYAQRKSDELGLRNLRFLRADLLSCADLETRFDAIESMGVLHHLADPRRGLRALLAVLKPRGWLRLGLYSATARRDITALREQTATATIEPTPKGLRAFRWGVLHSQHEPRSRFVASVPDFFNLHECRDLLFHVQEHVFTLPAIEQLLGEVGLVLRRFELPSEVPFAHYRRMFPGDVEMTDLQNWAQLEQRYPDTFIAMYQFWTQRRSDDRSGQDDEPSSDDLAGAEKRSKPA